MVIFKLKLQKREMKFDLNFNSFYRLESLFKQLN
jgi:hypothetical protein